MSRYVALFAIACGLSAGCAKEAGQLHVDATAIPGVPPVDSAFASAEEIKAAVERGDLVRVPDSGPVPESVRFTPDIEYVKRGNESLVLDLYAPKDSKGDAPGIVFIHGGGWRGGSRSFYAAWCAHFAERGYVCATIQYRFSDRAVFPGAVEDAMDAVRWMSAQSDRLGVDPDAIGIVGQSAGAHLALMAAYAPNLLRELGSLKPAALRVKAVAAFYPPVDFTRDGVRGLDPVQLFLGTRYVTDPKLYAKASPLTYVSNDDPPTLLVHGTVDDVVPVEQSDLLSLALKESGVACWYDRIEGWHHAMDVYVPAHDHCRAVLERFLNVHLPVRR